MTEPLTLGDLRHMALVGVVAALAGGCGHMVFERLGLLGPGRYRWVGGEQGSTGSRTVVAGEAVDRTPNATQIRNATRSTPMDVLLRILPNAMARRLRRPFTLNQPDAEADVSNPTTQNEIATGHQQ